MPTRTIPASKPDEYNEFVDRGTGKPAIIGRWGRRVLIADGVTREVRYEDSYKSVEHAAAGYANWSCDERADRPRRHDVVKPYTLSRREAYLVLSVKDAGRHRWLIEVVRW